MATWQQTAVQIVFWAATALTLALILRRPYLSVRLGARRLRMQSYFLGALLGPALILGFGFLSYGDVVRGIAGSDALQPGGVLALFLSMVFIVMKDLSGGDLTAAAFATIIGSNLGANLTPLGALAGIMWMGILRDTECHISFLQFVKYGLLVTPLTLAAALGVLALEIRLCGP